MPEPVTKDDVVLPPATIEALYLAGEWPPVEALILDLAELVRPYAAVAPRPFAPFLGTGGDEDRNIERHFDRLWVDALGALDTAVATGALSASERDVFRDRLRRYRVAATAVHDLALEAHDVGEQADRVIDVAVEAYRQAEMARHRRLAQRA
jgi:hypothetical protein